MEEEIFCNGMMEGCGDSDADRLGSLEQFRVMEERLSMGPFSDFLGPGWNNIYHTDQFHLLHFGIFFRMESTQVTNTDHAYPDLLHLSTDSPL